MGVRKFHSVEEMPGPALLPRLDPENLRIAFGLASLAHGLGPARRKCGVRKFRSCQVHIHSVCLTALVGVVSSLGCRKPYASPSSMSSTSTSRQAMVDGALGGEPTISRIDPLCHERPRCSIADRRPAGSPGASDVVVVRLAAPTDAATDEDRCDRREYWLSRPTGELLLAVDCEEQWGADNAGPASLTVAGTLATFHYVEFLSNDACEIVDASVRLPQGRIEAHTRRLGRVVDNVCRPSRKGAFIPGPGSGTLHHPLLVLHRP
jgi:hypothetical protein